MIKLALQGTLAAAKLAKKHAKDLVTKKTPGQKKISKATGGQLKYREGQRAGFGAGSVGTAAVTSLSGSSGSKKTKSPPSKGKVGRLKSKKPTGPKTVSVKSGDTLTKIAKDKNISLSMLKKLNPNIKNYNKIKPNQKIKIGGSSGSK